MKRAYFFVCVGSLFFLQCISCSNKAPTAVLEPIEELEVIDTPEPLPIITTAVPASIQRPGNPIDGKEYLFNGDYISSGVPYAAWIFGIGEDNSNLLGRTGDNAVISYDNTAVTAPNGVRIVGPNCLNCHSSKINNTYVIGLGQHDGDYTQNRATVVPTLAEAINSIYGSDSPEAEAYEQFRKSTIAIGPKTLTFSRGVNAANKIAEVLISHRDKNTLEWSDEPLTNITDEVIPSDVPAWWHLKKKNAMFHTGMSRMDFCKSFVGASLLTMGGLEKAKEVDEKMEDILAYIYSLEAPEYPFDINQNLSAQGKTIFKNTCSGCHGTYGDEGQETYPNFLVALETIGTDPELSNRYTSSSEVNTYFLDWFNNGWFGTDDNAIGIVPDGGYIAPPLDGVWATAPYFHNASVPTLADVINSKNRPEFWKRTFDNSDYDTSKIGWNYTVAPNQVDKNTYDTTLKGYGNGGHTFGDALTNTERTALLEYLKTL